MQPEGRESGMADQIAFPMAEDADEQRAGSGGTRHSHRPLFSVEQIGQTLIVVPKISGKMFRYMQLRHEANALRRKLGQHSIDGLILDLHALDYLGAEVIGAVIALARKMEDLGGHTVLCCAAPQLTEALTKMGLHRLWTLFDTRKDALAAIQSRA
jgi:anti-anti-sigma factor